jgi:hypothetical protein
MKYIAATFLYIMWLICTIVLVATLFGMVIVLDEEWLENGRNILSIFKEK